MQERNEQKPIEEEIWGLRDSIVSMLRARGGRANNSTLSPRLGIGAVVIAKSNHLAGSLLLCADNTWQEISPLFGDEISEPEVEDLLGVFALLTDEKYPPLFGRTDGKKYAEIVQERKDFVKSQRKQLAMGFRNALESASRSFPAS